MEEEPDEEAITELVHDACVSFRQADYEESHDRFKELILVAAHFAEFSRVRSDNP